MPKNTGATLGWIGNCVSPVTLFAMGIWMHGKGMREMFSMRMSRLAMFMLFKLIVVPLIMVGLANGMNLTNEAGR